MDYSSGTGSPLLLRLLRTLPSEEKVRNLVLELVMELGCFDPPWYRLTGITGQGCPIFYTDVGMNMFLCTCPCVRAHACIFSVIFIFVYSAMRRT